MNGLLCFVYRSGVKSSLCIEQDTVILCGEGIPKIAEPSENAPALLLKSKINQGREYFYAVPEVYENEQTAFGGNFIYTSDSRFPNLYPIPLHDRIEK